MHTPPSVPPPPSPQDDRAGSGVRQQPGRHDVEAVLRRRPEQWPSGVVEAVPAVDVLETPEAWVIRLDLPGVRHGDAEVHLSDGLLRVTALRRLADAAGEVRHKGRSGGHYRLDLPLPLSVDDARVSASFDAGLLTVVAGKAQSRAARRIGVTTRVAASRAGGGSRPGTG